MMKILVHSPSAWKASLEGLKALTLIPTPILFYLFAFALNVITLLFLINLFLFL